jgi:hypothetical protein
LIPGNITVNLGLLQILVNWNSLLQDARKSPPPFHLVFDLIIGGGMNALINLGQRALQDHNSEGIDQGEAVLHCDQVHTVSNLQK